MEAYDRLPETHRKVIQTAPYVPNDICLATRHIINNHPEINSARWLFETLTRNAVAVSQMYRKEL